jgi:hypothetical protein
LGIAVFTTIALAGLALDGFGRDPARARLGHTLRWLDTRPAGRLVLFTAWGFTGWHFFVR